MIALRRKLRIEDLAGDTMELSRKQTKREMVCHPPKDVDQEVGRKLLGSMEKSDSGSYTTSAKCEEEASVAIRIRLLLEGWRRWVCGGEGGVAGHGIQSSRTYIAVQG